MLFKNNKKKVKINNADSSPKYDYYFKLNQPKYMCFCRTIDIKVGFCKKKFSILNP